MKLTSRLFLTLLTSIISFAGFSQAELIEKVFSSKPVDFRSEVEIIDTLNFESFFYDSYEGYSYETQFGAEDFVQFLVYRHKTLNKIGLIIQGEKKSAFTDPVADSIVFLKALDYEYIEEFDEDGNYISYKYLANDLYFAFYNGGNENIWKIDYRDDQYNLVDRGVARRGVFKAVSLKQVPYDEYSSVITAVFVNLATNEIINSAVLNEEFVAGNAYYYDYGYYEGYYEGDGYYGEEGATNDADGYFETSLTYSPVEFIYFKTNDTISELVDYRILEYTAQPHKTVVPEDFNGAWSYHSDYDLYVIIDGDEISSEYGTEVATVDAYEGTYEVATLSWDEVLKKMNMPSEARQSLESKWQGPKTGIKFIAATGWSEMARFREYFIQNNENLAHVYYYLDASNNLAADVTVYKPEKVYSTNVISYYDPLLYSTAFRDSNGETVDLASAGVDYYQYESFGVAERNIDKDGNLLLRDEELGSIKLKTYAPGDYYLGKVKVSWVGSPEFGEASKIILTKQQPYQVVDESGKVLAPDVASLLIENVQGLNLFVITGSDGKMGVLGPDGSWLVKKEYDLVTVSGPSYSSYGYGDYYYDSYSSSRNFPVFFQVGQGEKFGMLDTKGNWIVPLEYDFVEVCTDEIIAVKDGLIGLYATDGKQILAPEYLAQGYYSAYTDCYTLDTYVHFGYKILSKDGLSGVMNKKHEVIVPFKYNAVVPTIDGKRFIVTTPDNKVGMIEMSGETVIPFEYEQIYAFDYTADRYVATKDGKQGVIDGRGNVLVPISYHSIQSTSEWSNNILLVYDANYYTNAIDTTGVMIIEASCGSIHYYSGYGIFSCADGVNYSFYDRNGTFLYAKLSNYLDPYNAYDNIQITPDDDYENPQYGAFDLLTGEDILATEFDVIYPIWISDQMFLVGETGGKVGVYDRTGKELVKPKGSYLDNYFYDYEDGGYFVEISNKKGKSKIIRLENFETYYYESEWE